MVLKRVRAKVDGASEMHEAEHALNVHAAQKARGAVAEFMGHVEVPATLGRLSKGTWLLWRYQGSRSLGYYLARRDCLTALAHDLGVGEELVVPTAMAQLFEALVQLHSAGIVHRDVKVWGGAAAAPPLPPLARPPARTPPPFHTTRSPTM